MATTIGNGIVTFGDGTQLGSANIPYGNITNPITNLSQFTNDLGNYGSWVTGATINTTPVSTGAYADLWLTVVGTGSSATLTLNQDNCNCNCACNC